MGAMVTTGGVLGTQLPLLCPRRGPTELCLCAVTGELVTGELWLVTGGRTGDDSPLTAEPERMTGMCHKTSVHLYRCKLCTKNILIS